MDNLQDCIDKIGIMALATDDSQLRMCRTNLRWLVSAELVEDLQNHLASISASNVIDTMYGMPVIPLDGVPYSYMAIIDVMNYEFVIR